MNSTEFQTDWIREKVDTYLTKNPDINQATLAKKIGVTEPQISLVRRGKFDELNGNQSRMVPDKALRKIVDYFQTDSSTWETSQYKTSFSLFSEAKFDKIQGILDGPTGAGKSHAVEDFMRQNPNESFLMTCDGDMGVRDFIDEWAQQVGADKSGSRWKVRRNIADKLQKMKYPVIFFDEMEEAKTHRIYSTIKGVYDDRHLYRHVGMVLIGANDYLGQLERLSERTNSHSFPQMISRFSGNYKKLESMTRKDCANVMGKYYKITDPDLIDQFYHESNNDYRILERSLTAYFRDLKLKSHGQKSAA